MNENKLKQAGTYIVQGAKDARVNLWWLLISLVLGVGIGYLIFNTNVPKNEGIEEVQRKLERDSIKYSKENEKLYSIISELNKKDSLILLKYDSISKKHRENRLNNAYDGTREFRIVTGNEDFIRLGYDR